MDETRIKALDMLAAGGSARGAAKLLRVSRKTIEHWRAAAVAAGDTRQLLVREPRRKALAPIYRRPPKIDKAAIRVSEYVFASPAEAADNFPNLWTEEELIAALASGAEVFRGEAIGFADAEFEAARIAARGEEAEAEREAPWYLFG